MRDPGYARAPGEWHAGIWSFEIRREGGAPAFRAKDA